MKKIIQNTAASLAFLILGLFWLASSFSIKVGSAAVSQGGTPRTVPQIVSDAERSLISSFLRDLARVLQI